MRHANAPMGRADGLSAPDAAPCTSAPGMGIEDAIHFVGGFWLEKDIFFNGRAYLYGG